MLKIENTEVFGWNAAIRGLRNPLNSWAKSDSYWTHIENQETENTAPFEFFLGDNDLNLMKRLVKSGSDHAKFLRMIHVQCDITAPTYWVAEHDTYKVSTVRNSCSFMHKGVSKPFDIRDFSLDDERIYDVLSPLLKKEYKLWYPYETDEYRMYTTKNGRQYKVYKNGRVFRCSFEYKDSWGTGRTRVFEEKEVVPTASSNGYFYFNLGGRSGHRMFLHTLVAHVWLDNPEDFWTVNHIDGDKGNNSVENLEWCTRSDNIKKGFDSGLYDRIGSLHCLYQKWKNGSDGVPRNDYGNENYDLFRLCFSWEKTLESLNNFRQEYLDTKDENLFRMIRQILPSGYNVRYTWDANYAVLQNIYFARRNHRLPEWHTFCGWIENLPYFTEVVIDAET